MLKEGQKAPDFSLPGVVYDEPEMYDLHRYVEPGTAVLLAVAPATFVPNCEDDLRALADAGWHERDDVTVWGLSADSLFASAAFAERYDVGFPLLSDFHAAIADSYDAVLDDWRGHRQIPERGLAVIDDDWTVQYAWETDDPFETPSPSPFSGAAETLSALLDEQFEPPTVEYRSGT